MLLSPEELEAIAKAVEGTNVTYDGGVRTLLLSGVKREYASLLSVDPRPAVQLRSDLTSLNRVRLEDGSVPLIPWLQQAVTLFGVYHQVGLLREKLEAAQQKAATAPLPSWPEAAPKPPPVVGAGELSGEERRDLNEALLSAFPSLGRLEQMVRFRMDENLSAVAGGSTLRDVVFDLVEWAEAQGRLAELIRGATAEVPGNPRLKEVVARLLPRLEAMPAVGGAPSHPTGHTEQPSAAARTLSFEATEKLGNALLRLSCMKDGPSRTTIIRQLPEEVRSRVDRSPNDRIEATNILLTALGVPNGLDELLKRLKHFENNGAEYRALNTLVRELLPHTRLPAAEAQPEAEPVSTAPLSPRERIDLMQKLSALPGPLFNALLFSLNPPAGLIPDNASLVDRAIALLSWAEGPAGRGLAEVRQVLQDLLNPQ